MRHDSRTRIASPAVALRTASSTAGYSAALTPFQFSPVSTFDGQLGGAAGAVDRVEQFLDLPHRGHPICTPGGQRGREIGAGRMQPGQHRGGDAVAAQAERLVDGGHPSSAAPAASAARATWVAPWP